jgi:putative ABC transport system substrate-binding protein
MLLGGAADAWPVVARAQSAKNVRRVGILWPGAFPPASPRLESFREGLREAGFIEGENLVIELRYSKTGRNRDALRPTHAGAPATIAAAKRAGNPSNSFCMTFMG